jgi:hypothetical protein
MSFFREAGAAIFLVSLTLYLQSAGMAAKLVLGNLPNPGDNGQAGVRRGYFRGYISMVIM